MRRIEDIRAEHKQAQANRGERTYRDVLRDFVKRLAPEDKRVLVDSFRPDGKDLEVGC